MPTFFWMHQQTPSYENKWYGRRQKLDESGVISIPLNQDQHKNAKIRARASATSHESWPTKGKPLQEGVLSNEDKYARCRSPKPSPHWAWLTCSDRIEIEFLASGRLRDFHDRKHLLDQENGHLGKMYPNLAPYKNHRFSQNFPSQKKDPATSGS